MALAGGRCALDLANRLGGMTLDDVGAVLGFTRERARQIQDQALERKAVQRAFRDAGVLGRGDARFAAPEGPEPPC